MFLFRPLRAVATNFLSSSESGKVLNKALSFSLPAANITGFVTGVQNGYSEVKRAASSAYESPRAQAARNGLYSAYQSPKVQAAKHSLFSAGSRVKETVKGMMESDVDKTIIINATIAGALLGSLAGYAIGNIPGAVVGAASGAAVGFTAGFLYAFLREMNRTSADRKAENERFQADVATFAGMGFM